METVRFSNPDEIFYSESSIKQKLTYLHGLKNSLEDDVRELWEHEDNWINSIADLKMKKIDIRTDQEFLDEDLNTIKKEGTDLQNKINRVKKRIQNEFGQAPITESKHFKVIVFVLLIIFALCLISFYFFIAFVVVSCGYFVYVFKNYLVDQKETAIKEQEKALLEKQLGLLNEELRDKAKQIADYNQKKAMMDEEIDTITNEHEEIQRKLDAYKQKRNDLEKTKQYLSILNQYDS